MDVGEWLKGVRVDSKTWLWLRRRYPSLVASRLKLGYLIVGIIADTEENGADLWESTSEAINGHRVQES